MVKKKQPPRDERVLAEMEQRCLHGEGSASERESDVPSDAVPDAAAVLAKTLFLRARCRWDERASRQKEVEVALWQIYRKSLSKIKKIEDFLETKALNKALILIFGEHEARQLLQLFSLRFRGAVTETVFRRGFHSSAAGDYIRGIFLPAIYRRICAAGYSLSLMDCLTRKELEVPPEFDLANRLALALRQQEKGIDSAVRAIVCKSEARAQATDPGVPPLSKEMVRGIIRSGHQPSIALLQKLFLSEETPQKLRLTILEAADEGYVETLMQFMELIDANHLYDSSLTICAFGSWTGLNLGADPALVKTCLRLSLRALSHPELFEEDMQSEHILIAYFALWARAMRDVSSLPAVLKALLWSPERDKKLLCLYFINDVMYDRLPFDRAVEMFSSQDQELLAWLLSNLLPYGLSESAVFRAAELPAQPRPDERLPKSPQARRRQFRILSEAAVRIGRGEKYFSGSLFPWLCRVLSAEPLLDCMINLALYDLDSHMVSELGRMFFLFNARQRGTYYACLTDPQNRPEDRRFLLEHIKDRSPANREILRRRLS